MPQGLTPKQEAFVRAYALPDENGKPRSGADAYRRSYNCENMTDKTVWEAASRLLANSKVVARLDELRADQSKKSMITAEMLIERNLKRAEMADAAGQHAAAVAAETLASKLAGILTERVDQTVRQADPADHKPDLASLRQSAATVAPQQMPSAPQPAHDSEAEKRVTH